MKWVASAFMETFGLTCPDCNEYLTNPNDGSQTFDIGEALPQTLHCYTCGLGGIAPPARVPGQRIIRHTIKP